MGQDTARPSVMDGSGYSARAVLPYCSWTAARIFGLCSERICCSVPSSRDETLPETLFVHTEAESAFVEQGDVVADLIQIRCQMRGKEDTPCAVFYKLLHITCKLPAKERIQSRGRFIHDEKFCLMGEGESKLEAGLLTFG